MIKIVFDLDGVLRPLDEHITEAHGLPYPQHWDWTYNGMDIFALMKYLKYEPLWAAKPTELVDFVNTSPLLIEPIEIWTAQPQDWMKLTVEWIEKYITRPHTTMFFNSVKSKESILYYKDDTYLVDDYPLFDRYDKILLMDKPYNQSVKASRVSSAKGLDLAVRLLNSTHNIKRLDTVSCVV